MAFTPKLQNWRWFNDDAAEPTDALAAENTAISIPSVDIKGKKLRLRQSIKNTGDSSNSFYVSLQYSSDQSTWTTIGSSATWNWADGKGSAGSTIAGLLLSDSDVKGKYYESWLTQSPTINAGKTLEVDITIVLSSGLPLVNYFRLCDYWNVYPLDSGKTYPLINITPPTGINASKAVAYAVIGPPAPAISASKSVAYSVLIDIQKSINVSKAVVYAVVEESSSEPPYDDGTPSGGIVFGGEVVEVVSNSYSDPAASGGIVFGGEADAVLEPEENHQIDGTASGGIVFGGEGAEAWHAEPNNWVAVKGGTYRIAGTLYTLVETLSYPGIGSIAALVDCGEPPAGVGQYRYDLLSIDAAGTITVTAGTAATTPVMPALPTSEIKLDHVLRYHGQVTIVQGDIGKLWQAPALTRLTATVTDDELAWGEASTAITVYFFDQYGIADTGAKSITATITTGNGAVSPVTQSGSGASFTFTYTRGGSYGDLSPVITFSSSAGPSTTVQISLLSEGADGPVFPVTPSTPDGPIIPWSPNTLDDPVGPNGNLTVSDSGHVGANAGWKCFDGNAATYWESNNGAGGYVTLDVGAGNTEKIFAIGITCLDPDTAPTIINLMGSNDLGGGWDLAGIGYFAGRWTAGGTQYFTPGSTGQRYRYWRITFQHQNGLGCEIAEITLYDTLELPAGAIGTGGYAPSTAPGTVLPPAGYGTEFLPHDMTGYTAPGPEEIDDGSEYVDNHYGWHCFDDDEADSYWRCCPTTTATLTIDLGAGNQKALYAYGICPHIKAEGPRIWQLWGSINGATWVSIDWHGGNTNWSNSGMVTNFLVYNLSAIPFRYFKFEFTAGRTGYLSIKEMCMYAW